MCRFTSAKKTHQRDHKRMQGHWDILGKQRWLSRKLAILLGRFLSGDHAESLPLSNLRRWSWNNRSQRFWIIDHDICVYAACINSEDAICVSRIFDAQQFVNHKHSKQCVDHTVSQTIVLDEKTFTQLGMYKKTYASLDSRPPTA